MIEPTRCKKYFLKSRTNSDLLLHSAAIKIILCGGERSVGYDIGLKKTFKCFNIDRDIT